MHIANELAIRVSRFRYEDLPGQAIQAAKDALLDTLGVTLAGSSEPAAAIVTDVLSGESRPGTSVAFGTKHKTNCLDAALMNGTAAHALDFDDVSDAMGGHPSAPVLAALLALGDNIEASGRDVVNAFVAGFETEIRIAKAVNFHHYKKGWHPTATLGVFGAAAACARLLSLEEQQIASALSMSASLSAGLKANFGTMTKPLHVGNCARSGLLAALLAGKEFTAAPDAFEHKQGFLNVFNGPGTYDVAKIFENWAEPLEIVDPGVVIKQYPCCASTHSAIDTLIRIVSENHIHAEDVSNIDVWIHERRLEHTNRPNPQNAMAAKFSLQYCLARALMHGTVVLEHFEGDAFHDMQARSIMSKVKAASYSPEQIGSDNAYGAEIKLTMHDGTVYCGQLDEALGQSAAHPLPARSLVHKFQNCAGRILVRDQVLELQESVERIENLRSVRDLTALTIPKPLR
ncbi:MAG TPA: MmgE/PrpD family protein [Candidatus Acidoferrales bacterium]|nr:MmgE/PrpD family protein [Candidatus Acidoferrales bacterium]